MYCKDCLSFGVCRYASGSRLLEKEPCADFMDIDKWVKLPCKVGTTIYRVQEYFNDATLHSEKRVKVCVAESASADSTWTDDSVILSNNCFGKTWFLTREEAERALKDRSGEDD